MRLYKSLEKKSFTLGILFIALRNAFDTECVRDLIFSLSKTKSHKECIKCDVSLSSAILFLYKRYSECLRLIWYVLFDNDTNILCFPKIC